MQNCFPFIIPFLCAFIFSRFFFSAMAFLLADAHSDEIRLDLFYTFIRNSSTLIRAHAYSKSQSIEWKKWIFRACMHFIPFALLQKQALSTSLAVIVIEEKKGKTRTTRIPRKTSFCASRLRIAFCHLLFPPPAPLALSLTYSIFNFVPSPYSVHMNWLLRKIKV